MGRRYPQAIADVKAFSKIHLLAQKSPLALYALAILLQRSPALKSLLSILEHQSKAPIPRILQSAILPSVALATPHALSGATTSTYNVQPANPSNGTVGVEMAIGFSINIEAESWRIEGELPPGLRATDLRKRINAENGILPTDFGLITGTPTQAGEWTLTLSPWENNNGTGDTAPEPLTLQINIEPSEAQGNDRPKLSFERDSQTLHLSWPASPIRTFQIQTSDNLSNWTPVDHTPIATNELLRISIPITSNTARFYRLTPSQEN